MRTREVLRSLIEGRLSTASAKDELVNLATRLIIEEGLEGEAGDAVGWDYYEHKSRQFLPSQRLSNIRASIAARAASPNCRSSNANSLAGQHSAGLPEMCATFQRDNL